MKVKIKSWQAVGTWTWNIDLPQCTICQLIFESPCPSCKLPGDDCPPVEGKCKHHFHLHCIEKWCQENDTCPLDRMKWETHK